MAIYHVDINRFTRSKGHSAVAAIAYRARAKVKNERTGEIHNYSHLKDLLHTEIIVPENSMHFADFKDLWNAVEEKERRKNSVVAREFEVSLPIELDKKQNLALAKNLSQKLVDRFGFALQYSIHWKDGNPHTHILASTRKLEKEGFTTKTRELDEVLSDKTGAVIEARKMIADTINEHLELNGFTEKVDHRSLKDQQEEAEANGDYIKALDLSRQPQRHVGKNPRFTKENEAYNKRIKQEHAESINQVIEQTEKDLKEEEQEEARKKAQKKAKKKEPVKTASPVITNQEQAPNSIQPVTANKTVKENQTHRLKTTQKPAKGSYASRVYYSIYKINTDNIKFCQNQNDKIFIKLKNNDIIQDFDNRIQLKSSNKTSKETVLTMMEMAQAKGWKSVSTKSTNKKFLVALFMSAEEKGINVNFKTQEQRDLFETYKEAQEKATNNKGYPPDQVPIFPPYYSNDKSNPETKPSNTPRQEPEEQQKLQEKLSKNEGVYLKNIKIVENNYGIKLDHQRGYLNNQEYKNSSPEEKINNLNIINQNLINAVKKNQAKDKIHRSTPWPDFDTLKPPEPP